MIQTSNSKACMFKQDKAIHGAERKTLLVHPIIISFKIITDDFICAELWSNEDFMKNY